MWLRAKNQGEIEINAFKLLGACTKRDQDKIGYFGTGLKYAISVLMREGIGIKVFSGEQEIILGTIEDSLRGMTFKVITVNGEKTSLTTDTGIKWQVWQAVREIVCNAIDEEGTIAQVKDIVPVAGETHVYIEGKEKVEEVCKNWDRYFAFNRESIYECTYGKIYEPIGPKINVYRKDIRCFEDTDQSLFDYDLPSIDLGEDRIASSWYVRYYISHMFKDATVDILRRLIENWTDMKSVLYETYLDPEYIDPGPNWVLALKGKQVLAREFAGHFMEAATKSTAVLLPAKLVNKLCQRYPTDIEFVTFSMDVYHQFVEIQKTQRQQAMLESCLDFLRVTGLYHEEEIKVGTFIKDRENPLVTEGKIIIPTKLFNQGQKMLAAHLLTSLIKLGESSNLITEYITLLEEKHNKFL